MNAPFRTPAKNVVIEEVLATATVSISDLKKNPAAVVSEAQLRQVAILNRNRPVAYLIAPHVWEHLCEVVADRKLAEEAQEALDRIERGEEKPIPVTLDELLA